MVKPLLFLTGGSGMVGRNIREHPYASRWKVLAPTSGELDLTDFDAVDRFFQENQIETVIHAAGYVGGIQANATEPIQFLDRNLTIGRNVIMGAYKKGIRNFINLASTCMYPRSAVNPLKEDSILTGELEPTNEGYALAKILSTRLCQYIQRTDPGRNFKTLIPCNLYGRYDKFDPFSSHLIPAIIAKIHQAKTSGLDTVEIWGDGSARREFMYAGDLADAVLKAAQNPSDLPDLMNCGMGHDLSVGSYYEAVADVLGWKGKYLFDLTKPVGMAQKLCSIDRQLKWGWCPSTKLYDGIKLTYNFFLNLRKF